MDLATTPPKKVSLAKSISLPAPRFNNACGPSSPSAAPMPAAKSPAISLAKKLLMFSVKSLNALPRSFASSPTIFNAVSNFRAVTNFACSSS